ncbi:hypothetical protein N9S30_00325 [bacterium]|nr:hypothetical protein [bacterium]
MCPVRVAAHKERIRTAEGRRIAVLLAALALAQFPAAAVDLLLVERAEHVLVIVAHLGGDDVAVGVDDLRQKPVEDNVFPLLRLLGGRGPVLAGLCRQVVLAHGAHPVAAHGGPALAVKHCEAVAAVFDDDFTERFAYSTR